MLSLRIVESDIGQELTPESLALVKER